MGLRDMPPELTAWIQCKKVRRCSSSRNVHFPGWPAAADETPCWNLRSGFVDVSPPLLPVGRPPRLAPAAPEGVVVRVELTAAVNVLRQRRLGWPGLGERGRFSTLLHDLFHAVDVRVLGDLAASEKLLSFLPGAAISGSPSFKVTLECMAGGCAYRELPARRTASLAAPPSSRHSLRPSSRLERQPTKRGD